MIFLDFDRDRSPIDNIVSSAGPLGWNIIGSSFPTDYGTTIDILAFDNDGIPLIVQFKRNPEDNIALEALSYYNNITGHKSAQADFMVQNKYPDTPKLLWERAKLVLIAPSFNKYDLDTISSFPVTTDTCTYAIMGDKMILSPQYVPVLDYPEEEGEAYAMFKDSLDNDGRDLLNNIEQYLCDVDANIKRITIGSKIRYYIITDLLSVSVAGGEIIMRIGSKSYGSKNYNLPLILREAIRYGK